MSTSFVAGIMQLQHPSHVFCASGGWHDICPYECIYMQIPGVSRTGHAFFAPLPTRIPAMRLGPLDGVWGGRGGPFSGIFPVRQHSVGSIPEYIVGDGRSGRWSGPTRECDDGSTGFAPTMLPRGQYEDELQMPADWVTRFLSSAAARAMPRRAEEILVEFARHEAEGEGRDGPSPEAKGKPA